MRRSGLAFATVVLALALAPAAKAADPPPASLPPLPGATAPTAPTAPSVAPAPGPGASTPPAVAPNGVAVLAMAGATDAAWPLAQSVYGAPTIRPYGVDEMHARVLCGEPAAPASPPEVRDLADTVAAVRGEDAASRAVLADIARRLNVRALAVVRLEAGKPTVRVFVAETQTFDAASYAPDAATPAAPWTATTASLSRAFGGAVTPSGGAGGAPAGLAAPALATHEQPAATNEPPKSKAFYESGWFWGAIGAAAFAGGAVFFATRDNGPTTIHLDMQVPH